jgi:RNA-directed DNA polymerase
MLSSLRGGFSLVGEKPHSPKRKYILLPEAFAVNGTGLPEAVFKLRKRLYIKAKQEPKYRFYALYDRIYRRDVLVAAWDRVAANDGSPGVDGVCIKDIRTSPNGVEGLMDVLHNTLKAKRYRPQTNVRASDPTVHRPGCHGMHISTSNWAWCDYDGDAPLR